MLYLVLGVIIGILLTFAAQSALIAVLFYTSKPKEMILKASNSIANEAKRRIQGKAVLIPPSSPIEQQVHQMMQNRTVRPEV